MDERRPLHSMPKALHHPIAHLWGHLMQMLQLRLRRLAFPMFRVEQQLRDLRWPIYFQQPRRFRYLHRANPAEEP